MDFTKTISLLCDGKPLDVDSASSVFENMFREGRSDVKTTAFLTALACRGIDGNVLAALALQMRQHAIKPAFKRPSIVFDLCGTGGDGLNTFNVSTASAFIVASAGIPVAKHCNKAVSSSCGSADVAAFFNVLPASVEETIQDFNSDSDCSLSFVFAQLFHPSLKKLAALRREIGFKTIFNVLGPLANPFSPNKQLIGVYSPALLEPVAHALPILGVEHALVVCCHGLDEVGVHAPTRICEISGGSKSETYVVTPEELGLSTCDLSEVLGNGVEKNAEIVYQILCGRDLGAKTDFVLANAGTALYAADAVSSIKEGVEYARQLISEKKPLEALQALQARHARDALKAQVVG